MLGSKAGISTASRRSRSFYTLIDVEKYVKLAYQKDVSEYERVAKSIIEKNSQRFFGPNEHPIQFQWLKDSGKNPKVANLRVGFIDWDSEQFNRESGSEINSYNLSFFSENYNVYDNFIRIYDYSGAKRRLLGVEKHVTSHWLLDKISKGANALKFKCLNELQSNGENQVLYSKSNLKLNAMSHPHLFMLTNETLFRFDN